MQTKRGFQPGDIWRNVPRNQSQGEAERMASWLSHRRKEILGENTASQGSPNMAGISPRYRIFRKMGS